MRIESYCEWMASVPVMPAAWTGPLWVAEVDATLFAISSDVPSMGEKKESYFATCPTRFSRFVQTFFPAGQAQARSESGSHFNGRYEQRQGRRNASQSAAPEIDRTSSTWSTQAIIVLAFTSGLCQASRLQVLSLDSGYANKMTEDMHAERLNITGPTPELAALREAAASPAMDSAHMSLDGHGIFAVIVFAIVMLIVIQPVRIPVPFAVSQWLQGHWKRALGQRNDEQSGPVNTVDERHRGAKPSSSEARPERHYLTLNHVSAPIVGIILLLATKTIGGEQLRLGIVGQEGVEPYDALLLFLGLAYIAVSLDATGLLRYLAFHVSIRGGRSGPRLFFMLYGFFFFLGLLVGNDAVILSGTSFLVYFTRIAGLSRPDAWIWAQFAAANIASATLVSSNLTNVVIANGFGLKFTTFSAFMALPTVASGFTAALTIRSIFVNRSQNIRGLLKEMQQKTLGRQGEMADASRSGDATTSVSELPIVDTSSRRVVPMRRTSHAASSDKFDGQASGPDDWDETEEHQQSVANDRPLASRTSNVASTTKESQTKRIVFIPPYLIPPDVNPRSALVDPFGAIYGSVVMAATLGALVGTSVAGGVKVYQVAVPGACVCLLRDLWKDLGDLRRQRSQSKTNSVEQGTSNEIELSELPQVGQDTPTLNRSNSIPDGPAPPPRLNWLARVLQWPSHISAALPTISHVAARLPLPLLPFAFGMFILDEGLAHVGFIGIMARGLGKICATGGEAGTTFFIGFLSVVLCCFGGTNIGASILLVRSIQDAGFQARLPANQANSITSAALFSLALGSNVGALGGTFAASLAGFLWRGCLRHGGITVRPGQFFVWSMLTMPLSLMAGLVVVWAQIKSGKWPTS